MAPSKMQEAWKMLILTPRPGESHIIADDIEVTLLSTNGDKVKIGTDAPEGVTTLSGGCTSRSRRKKPKPTDPATVRFFVDRYPFT